MSKKVAIVAVHGVGKHLPGETQEAIVDLLLSLPARGPYGSARQYTPFEAVGIRIPLQPVQTCSGPSIPEKRTLWQRLTHLYEEQSVKFANRAESSKKVLPGEAGLAFTEQLLRDYAGGEDGNVYQTSCLHGRKLSDDTDVDVYEVLWSDLAKPNNTVIRFFLSLFQLILHIASLSRLAIDTGAAEAYGGLWRVFRAVHRYAVRLFQIFIPLVEVLLLIAVGACLIEVCSATRGNILVPIALGAAGAIAGGVVWITRARREVLDKPSVWAVYALLLVAAGAAIPLLVLFLFGLHGSAAGVRSDVAGALLFWLIPGFGFLFWLSTLYDGQRKGVFWTAMLFYGASLVTFGWFLRQASLSPVRETQVVVLATLWTAQLLLSAGRLLWGLMVVCAILSSLLGGLAWRDMRRRKPDGPEWGRARAAVRTSRLALALPTILFLSTTLLIWAACLEGTQKLLPAGEPIFSSAVVRQATGVPWYGQLEKWLLLPPRHLADPLQGAPATQAGQQDYAFRVLAWTMGYHLPVTLTLVAITVFLLAWWVLPSVLTEGPLRRGVRKPPRDTSDAVCLRMGTWLSRGLDATTVVTMMLFTAIFLVPIAYKICLSETLEDAFFERMTLGIVVNPLVGFALLATIAKGAQTVLATILDVDTYLRTTPIHATPRATIFERYISTLRYVRSYRDAQGRGYDSVVIFAHSLGALISGDLLHYLQSDFGKKEWYSEPAAGPRFTTIPITLMTVGNPARQLLNRSFPYLYDWVRTNPDNGKKPLPAPLAQGAAAIEDDALPKPEDLGLVHWINAYRSGDYVGRSLWLDEWFYRPAHSAANPVPTLIASPNGGREEMCIGAGAHCHYMDDTAPDIAFKLHSLL
jgi:hypothetical protein